MNICSDNGPMHYVPMSWYFDSGRDFTNFVRQNILSILNWSHESHIPKAKTKIAVCILEPEGDEYWSWDFIISLKNIREAKPYINLNREDFEILLRDSKIDSVLHD